MRWLFGLAPVWVLGSLSVASAVTIRVPEDYPTILAGVDAAVSGDSVLVAAGTWRDTETRSLVADGIPLVVTACAFPKGGVTLIGAGRDATILDLSDEDPIENRLRGIMIVGQPGEAPIRVEDLTVTGVWGVVSGGALSIQEAELVEIRNCRFTQNGPADLSVAGDSAVLGARGSSIRLTECLVDSNVSRAGLLAVLESSIEIVGCRFEGNLGRILNYSDLDYAGYHVLISESEFVRNRAENGAACVSLAASSDFHIAGCLFSRNVSETGEGAAIRLSGGSGTVEFCVFERDSTLTPNSVGAAIWWANTQGVVRNCTFVGCHSPGGASAFGGAFGGTVVFHSNVVTHSSGQAAALRSPGTQLLTGTGCNILWENLGGDYGEWSIRDGDEIMDPLYCDLPASDYSVRHDSPCLVGPCAPVGALGQGCGTVSVEASSWARIKSLYRD